MPEMRENRNSEEKERKRKKAGLSRKSMKHPVQSIPTRVNLLFFVIFILFMILIGRLYNMQVLNHRYYADKESGGATSVKIIAGSPRGNIYDSTGKVLASSTTVEAVKFTRSQNMTAAQLRAVADRLSTMISSSSSTMALTTRDKQDYFLADQKNLNKIAESLTKKEQTDSSGNELSGSEIYKVELKKVTAADINFNAQQTFAAQLFKAMNSTSTFNTTTIAVGNITPEEQATIAANESNLAGISMGTSWNRSYASTTLTNLLGTVSSEKAGLPAEDEKKYLAEGYQRNDRVGISYLEKSYEKYLQGTHQISKVKVNSNGKVTGTKVVQKGKRGDALKLTVNLSFQQSVDNILQTELQKAVSTGAGKYGTGAYAVVLNAKTGAVLAMSGFKRDPITGQLTSDALGTMNNAYEPGSAAKPATLTTGWASGAITGNQTITDQIIKLQGSAEITSDWGSTTPVPLNAVQALEYSSNSYIAQVALAMLGQTYQANMYLGTSKTVEVWKDFRKTFASYGLGVSTGFDISGEATGLHYANSTAMDAVFQSFGQFDTYTPLQMAVYASTLANNGKRISPHIVQGIYESDTSGNLGSLVKSIESKVMDNVDITASDMNIIKQGMYQVTHGSYSSYGFGPTGLLTQEGITQSISEKTGTAQTSAQNAQGGYLHDADGNLIETYISNAISFAPSDNPQIAVAVMVPNTSLVNKQVAQTANYITNDIYKLYFGNAAYQTGD